LIEQDEDNLISERR